MHVEMTIGYVYLVMGLFIIIFSKKVSEWFYKLVLLYTSKKNLKDVFLFKVDHTNRDSLLSLARTFTIFLGLSIAGTAVYFLYF